MVMGENALGQPVGFLLLYDIQSGMKPDDSNLILLKIEDRKKYENTITYLYAGSDPSAVHKPITVYKETNANAYIVAGRYVGVDNIHLKYRSLSDEERKVVAEKLGSGKVIKFLTREGRNDSLI